VIQTPYDEYRSPLITRYASEAMRKLFSERHRIRTWRDLWIWLAEAEREMGLDIASEQIRDLEEAKEDIDFAKAAEYEARFRHDVMAHVHAYGDVAPSARGVIHLGATSCYVTDNADAIILREALGMVARGLAQAIDALADFARRNADVPCLAFTHFQPAQPTTVGKRACLWIQDLLEDLKVVEEAALRVPFLGSKGTTGTQASFMTLFDGDAAKVDALDQAVARRAGFERSVPVSGQTYPRKADYRIVAALGGVGISASRLANDVRLLSGVGELSEPFEKDQIGSSAMAYKRNPMRSERVTSLSRHLLAMVPEAAAMAAAQWLERTLDDSAGRRMFLPEAFLTTDAILRLVVNVARGLQVNEPVVRARLRRELPFMATEEILMRVTQEGGDRQELHEHIRQHSVAAKERLLEGAETNDLIARIAADAAFATLADDLESLLEPERFVGRAPEQVRTFLKEHVAGALAPYRDTLGEEVRIQV
jgi:adenylosuccinate lyase